jgi:hypothetical protein
VYVHLGGDLVVTTEEIVAILDARAVQGSDLTREFLSRAREGGRIRGGSGQPDAKSWVVTTGGVYASGLSTATLARRIRRFRHSAVLWMIETPGRTRRLRV